MNQCRYPYKACYVYGLVDPRTDQIFYVGKTVQQSGRYYAHSKDSSSAAYPRMRELAEAGFEAEMRILGTFPTEDRALDYEYELINSMRGLLNRSPGVHPNTKYLRGPPRECAYISLEEVDTPEAHCRDEDVLWVEDELRDSLLEAA